MLRRWMRGSKGVQTLEWVALALVVLALIGAVTAYLNGPGGAQVAAPVQQALQRYAWCLEGAGGCPGAGGGNAFGTNPPGVRPPGGNPPGANPPGGNPPGVNPPGGKPPDPGWCVTHPGDCLSNLGKWAADKWEDVKRGAGQAWEGLKSTAEGVWKWLDEHKGIVAGVVVAGLILATGGLALPALAAAGGAFLFGLLYQLSGPKPGWQGWLEALALAGIGAVMGYLIVKGGIMLFKKEGLRGILGRLASDGILGGLESGTGYLLLTPSDQWSIDGLVLAVGAGVVKEVLVFPLAKAAVTSVAETIGAALQDARRRNICKPNKLTWQTPIRGFGKSIFIDQPGQAVYSRGVNKILGWLRVSVQDPAKKFLTDLSWDVIKNKLFGI